MLFFLTKRKVHYLNEGSITMQNLSPALLWGNKLLGSIKGKEFLDQLSDHQLLEEDSTCRDSEYFRFSGMVNKCEDSVRCFSLLKMTPFCDARPVE
jgi:hypothetical protein